MALAEPDDKDSTSKSTSYEQYTRMDEREKDAEIQKAIDRLQRRIQEILYLLETDTQSIAGQKKPKNDQT